MRSNRKSKGEQSRARLLEAAAAEFAVNGYHRAKVSDIVSRAELTQAAFYLYFTSKEAIYQELMDSFFAKLWELADAGSEVTALEMAEVPSRIRANLLELFRFFAKAPELTAIVLTQSQEGEALHRRLAAMVQSNLMQNQAAGHVRKDLSAEVTAEAMVAMIYRLTVRYLLPGEKTAEQLADEAVSFLVWGLLQKSE